MARRGDVLELREPPPLTRTHGHESRPPSRVLVLQDDRLNLVRELVVVAPLDVASALYEGSPTAVPISAAEAGGEVPMVALIANLHSLSRDAFQPGAVGRLRRGTVVRIDAMLRFVLGVR